MVRLKKTLAVMAALLAALTVTGCGGSGGGTPKAEKPALVRMVEEKGQPLAASTLKLKYLSLPSEAKNLLSPTYMPSMIYLRDGFYAIDKKTKNMVKMVVKDGTLTVVNPSVATGVQYLTGTDGETLYYRTEGKAPTTHLLTKEDKEGGELTKIYSYVTPAKDKKKAFSWSNSGTILMIQKKDDGTFEEPKRPFVYLPQDDMYTTAGWFDVGTSSFFVQGSTKKDRKAVYTLRECNFDGTLKFVYGDPAVQQFGSYAVLKDYVVHAKHNNGGYDIYSRADAKLKGNISRKELGTNATLMAAVWGNTFAICDSYSKTPVFILVTVE